VVFIVARVCPAVTVSPTATFTPATVPATAKDAFALSVAATVPTEFTTCSTEPMDATAVR
jgi:hypothetical protein